MKFQYVSNAGIVFDVEGKTIGIDCLCKDSSHLYLDTPIEIREDLKLDILIFTHEHKDHFCAEYVKEAWEKNPMLQIYSAKRVIECLTKADIPNNNLKQVQDGMVLRIANMQIQFIETIHEGEQYSDVENLTLLINIEGKHLVITGDAMPCEALFERIAKWSPHMDWLFAPFPYVGLRSTRKLIKEHLNVQNIFVVHLPRPEKDAEGWIKNTKKVCAQAKDGLPEPIFPPNIGNWYEL